MNTTDPSLKPRRRGRPPKQDGAYLDTRERLVRTGVAILTEKGFSAVGIEEILASAGVPKGSFYYYFGSKEEFGGTLIAAYAEYFARKLDRWFLDESRPALQRLRDFVEDAKAGMARFDFRRGCLVGNLGQEMGTLPEPFREKLNLVFLDWQARTSHCLRAAQAAGQIGIDLDCDHLAEFFWIGWEGAVLRAKLERSPAPLDAFSRGFFAALHLQA
ncbi:TetR/AcrR family transcriptional regulator [Azospirillum brasilense]|uniref:acrylate utilization transcriptional regulator AcuR n=1 Tax=Azospirillum brasilense TaxID=192 RepID=UPI001EDB87E3|nr:TetR family transcriptional regulator C-terminal domain-containing protein [Azospirillum brasilense]UKJ76687.1 TetR family transcriptional regulator C-terminal domain-containing protein [Azospirillum brasilense]